MGFEKNGQTDYLFEAILSLKDSDECYRFFEDLCTAEELRELSRRMLAARMLHDNCIYSQIASETGLSTATISRVSRSIKYGNGGYNTVLGRMEKK